MAIRSIESAEEQLSAVFGFGSFFRGESFRDIDVLAVTSPENKDTLRTYYLILDVLDSISGLIGCPVHLTVFTQDEFNDRPLQNMDELQTLWKPD
jgi:predicted nucleotidyltransferase